MDHNTFTPVDGTGLRFAIVRARFNADITQGLLSGAQRVLYEAGVKQDDIRVITVPGSFEIIHAAHQLAETGRFDAIIALGCIIKGATKHDEYLAEAVYGGMRDIMLKTGTAVVGGVLTVNTLAQAVERSGDGPMNRGAEAAHTALEMGQLSTSL